MTSEREKEIREHWDKKKNEEGFSFFGYEDLIEEIERLKSESIERNKLIRVQGEEIKSLKYERDYFEAKSGFDWITHFNIKV